jgi:phage tail-like protein
VILKRGITASRDAWNWFDLIHHQGALSKRYTAFLAMAQPGADGGGEALVWRFNRVMPVKCKVGDLNAATTAIAIEELHLVHEGMTLEPRA